MKLVVFDTQLFIVTVMIVSRLSEASFFFSSRCHPLRQGGCRFVAAMLHFFFLGVFSWMLLEGVQLYRMVVLVFNTTIRPLYLFLVGYGAPLAIVIICAIIRPTGYGTTEQ